MVALKARFLLQCLSGLVTVLGALPVLGAQRDSLESRVEPLTAAYLVNIAKFVSWADQPEDIGLCLSADSNVYGLLKSAAPVQIGQSRLLVHPLGGDGGHCDMVFVDSAEQASQLAAERAGSVLTIGFGSDMIGQGLSMVLYPRDLKLRVVVDQSALTVASYSVSSKFLRLSSVESFSR